MKEAVINKTKRYKFGKFLNKGEIILVKEEKIINKIIYVGFRKDNPILGFGLNLKDFTFK